MAGDPYYWLKAGHIVFVISLMAGLLIYPRYKIHQLGSRPGEVLFTTMQQASGRLRVIILNPSLVLVWIFGLAMVALDWHRGGNLYATGWFQMKFVLVIFLTGLQMYFIRLGRTIDAASGTMQASTLRMMNEVPFLIMIGVVLLVVLKPF